MNDSPLITRDAAYFLLLTAALSVAPFLPNLPWGIGLLAALLLLWRTWLAKTGSGRPSLATLLLAALLGATITALSYHTLFGKQAGLSMLALLLPLKLLEANTRRDARAALLLCCFMMTGQFLNAQNLAVAAMVLLCTVAILATSARLEQPALAPRPALRTALRLLGSALPLMLLLFVLFPRVDGPLWGLPLDAYSGTTGLSDRMQPGSISQLIQSGEIAFRAEFPGELPPPRERYWRGPVLTDFDGREWKERPGFASSSPRYTPSGPGYRYTLTLEPHNHNWMLALDFPGTGANDAIYAETLNLLSRQPVRNRLRYTLESFPATHVGLPERAGILRSALQLPAGSNPRTVAQGKALQESIVDPAIRTDAAISFMRQARLSYTLNPPILGIHSADEFLFNSKRGFCEHFAGSFVVLMRAAGVPARVVTGYQGGELNPLDGTLVVRQSDAHAWAEVWLPERGWLRVDPTAASSPERIDDGIANSLAPGDQLPLFLRHDSELLRSLRYRWEALSNGWNQWVLGYNAHRQIELMRSLGLPNADWQQLASLLGASAAIWLLWLLIKLWPRHARADALEQIWQSCCKKLAHQGLHKATWETADSFARHVALVLPQHADTITQIAEQYARLRYGATPATREDLATLANAVKQFRP